MSCLCPARLARVLAAVLTLGPVSPLVAQSAPPSPEKAGAAPAAKAGPAVAMSGLVQVWAIGGDEGQVATARLRRVEVKLTGQLAPRARWTVMADLAKVLSTATTQTSVGGTGVLTGASIAQSSRPLQDAFISVGLPAGATLDVGQFKLPIALESQIGSNALEVAERALFITDRARGGAYGDLRDVGVALRGKAGARTEYQLSAYNGMGEAMNTTDATHAKAVAARVGVRPWAAAGLQLGLAATTDVGGRGATVPRQRVGGDVQLARGRAAFRGEIMTGRDGAIRRAGGYAMGLWTVRPGLRAVARLDQFDPNTHTEAAAATVTERDVLVGIAGALGGPALTYQVNLVRKTFMDVAPTRHQALLKLQAAW